MASTRAEPRSLAESASASSQLVAPQATIPTTTPAVITNHQLRPGGRERDGRSGLRQCQPPMIAKTAAAANVANHGALGKLHRPMLDQSIKSNSTTTPSKRSAKAATNAPLARRRPMTCASFSIERQSSQVDSLLHLNCRRRASPAEDRFSVGGRGEGDSRFGLPLTCRRRCCPSPRRRVESLCEQ